MGELVLLHDMVSWSLWSSGFNSFPLVIYDMWIGYLVWGSVGNCGLKLCALFFILFFSIVAFLCVEFKEYILCSSGLLSGAL